jgi:proteasome-associated ATPase
MRPGRLDVKIKIERPDEEAAKDVFRIYLTSDLPLHDEVLARHGGDREGAVRWLIERVVEVMYAMDEVNRFLEVTYASGDKEVLYFKDFSSGAMIESIVGRAKKAAIKRFLDQKEQGIKLDDLIDAIHDEYKESENLPTTNPDDWLRISGKKGERIVFIRTLLGGAGREQRPVETITPGQYL